jgi:Predicted pPIWI-associating nuclease
MSTLTPIAARLQIALDAEYLRMQNEWFFKWHHIGRDSVIEIDGFDGKMIRYGGIKFSGSARDVYWMTIQRYARQKVGQLFDGLEAELQKYPLEIRSKALDEAQALIRVFLGKIRKATAEKDRVLRGNGFEFPPEQDLGNWVGAQPSDIESRTATLRHIYFDLEVAKRMAKDEWVSAAEAVAMLKPTLGEYSACLRICERAHAGLIRARAEQFHIGQRAFHDHEIPKEFWWAKGHQALEQDWTVGDFSTWIERGSIELKAFGVTFARPDVGKLLPPPSSVKAEKAVSTEEDELIIDKLDALVPSAALSYKQAILDLRDESRVSFRGPALELREALREILDHLAPDSEVTAAPGYVQEKDRAGPTMKQKVRFIMKKKGRRSSSDASEQAITAFDEAIAGLTRAVYERSSKATHVAGERQTVAQLRRFVVAIFHEIIET